VVDVAILPANAHVPQHIVRDAPDEVCDPVQLALFHCHSKDLEDRQMPTRCPHLSLMNLVTPGRRRPLQIQPLGEPFESPSASLLEPKRLPFNRGHACGPCSPEKWLAPNDDFDVVAELAARNWSSPSWTACLPARSGTSWNCEVDLVVRTKTA